ncbi:translation elongation factor Ts [Microbulbifer thermotolerans]|uniref:Elongation factor Ts n=1 Tax=Microbulbifer thermotolerans TaxID=252514 RepID=A0A143HKG6_MICTH|nr:translation elongation factor Ts [Microbulbifer thermotolerans]AMX02219.1 elongation factor Ts [Microbulbifer thermotolerans]MCX2778807.1 translation elongation factor Ts [Microbulbifer thermotolerans]MCX2781921.1 translation elongation factor Ts [Microbulbifer thermotolerans]MCX2793693.1 translation elongation factor Ts [Microbulbifer thermotolerans]MCX2800877.1 translation elongation factor Ts [Microbulbifer thermotolerans]
MAITASMVKELRERTGLPMMECKKALTEADGDIEKAIENLRKASGLKAAKKAGRTAADGIVAAKVAEDGSYGVLVEVNSETDFVARDDNFQAFVVKVVDKAFAERQEDVAALMEGELEAAREALVQKIGENIGVRRVQLVEAPVVGAYVHSNSRIAALVALSGGSVELAKDVAMHVAAVNPQVNKPEDMPADVLDKEKEIIKAQPDMEGKPAEIVEKMMGGRIKKFLKENSLVEQPFVKNPDVSVGKLVKDGGAEVVSFVRFEVGEGIEKEETDFAAEVAAQVKSSS